MIHTLSGQFARIPTPTASLALALASLGWVMEKALPLGGMGQTTGAVVATCMLTGLALKFLLRPSLLWADLGHPVTGSILPTFAMGLMVVSKTVGGHWPMAGQYLWAGAVALHLALMLCFFCRRLPGLQIRQMVPSWFVPPVGIITAALTLPGASFTGTAYALMLFGLVCYGLMLPLMVYRLIFHSEIPDAAKPTIAVLAAPASLALAGYLSIEPDPSLLLCGILLGIALLMTTVIYVTLLRLLRLPFSPAYAAFTFPLVISATALYKVVDALSLHPATLLYATQLRWFAAAELAIAATVVTYVSLRFAGALRCRHAEGTGLRNDRPVK